MDTHKLHIAKYSHIADDLDNLHICIQSTHKEREVYIYIYIIIHMHPQLKPIISSNCHTATVLGFLKNINVVIDFFRFLNSSSPNVKCIQQTVLE